MKFLVTGTGQLGFELEKLLSDDGRHEFIVYNSTQMDITNQKLVEEIVKKEKPDWIINAAAYTKVDLAQGEGKELNWKVNHEGELNIVQAAKSIGAGVVYVSTDYVFNGQSDKPIKTTERTDPINEYGKSKLAGELETAKALTKYYIVRTSWVYGQNGNNFVFTMQKLAKKLSELTVVNDQQGRPTWAKNLAEFILYLIENNSDYGTYNFSNDGQTTWYGFAKEILKNENVKITPVDSSAFKTEAKRPAYSVLDLEKSKQTGFKIADWKTALIEFQKTLN